MCRNAMVYNRPETIYYKAAKKLLHAALKMTSADKLRATPALLPLLSSITAEELGFELDSSAVQSEEDEQETKPNIKLEENSLNNDKFKSDENTCDDIITDSSFVKPTQNQPQ